MAQPTKIVKKLVYTEEEIREANRIALLDKLGAHQEAIFKTVDLLETLNQEGFIDMIHAAILKKEDAITNIFTEINKDRYAPTLESLSQLIFFIGKINVKELGVMMDKVNLGLDAIVKEPADEEDKTSYMDILKALKDPEINRSVTMLMQFLRGMGKA